MPSDGSQNAKEKMQMYGPDRTMYLESLLA